MTKDLWHPIHNDQLAGHLRLGLPQVRVAIADIQALEVKAVEGTSDVRVIVDADHNPALAAAHEIGNALVLLEWEVHAISGGLPVGRVHIKERVGAIVSLGTVEPAQVLDIRASETLPRGRQVLLNAQQVDGRYGGRGTERLSGDLATEGMLLQVEEPGGALDVGEGLRTRHLLPLEDLPGAERPFELAHELF